MSGAASWIPSENKDGVSRSYKVKELFNLELNYNLAAKS